METVNTKQFFEGVKLNETDTGCYVFLKRTKKVLKAKKVKKLNPVYCNFVAMGEDDFSTIGCFESTTNENIVLTHDEFNELKTLPYQENGFDFLKWCEVGHCKQISL